MIAALCLALAGPAACDAGGDRRETPRATGRAVDEPFADLYVVAGKKGAGRLYAMDLLNLELEPLAKRRDLRAIVAVCDRTPVVRAGGDRTLLILEDDALVEAPRDVLEGDVCRGSEVAGRIRGWRRLALAPNGERVLVAQGRRVGVMSAGGGRIEQLGRTRLSLTSAVWPAPQRSEQH